MNHPNEPPGASSSRLRIVLLLYFTYLGFYLARKADAITKSSLLSEEGFTLNDLAVADTCYLGTYTFALFASGMIGARVPSNVMLAFGLCGVALTSYLKSRSTSNYEYWALQALHAVFQSTGWPTCVKVLAAWVNRNRGTVMGVWTTCQSLGGVIGALAATWFLTGYGWEMAYVYHVPILLAMAVVDYVWIKDEPPVEWAQYFQPENPQASKEASEGSSTTTKAVEASSSHVTLSQVVALPGVLAVGASYFFLKFMRYALLFWLPFYYEKQLGYNQGLAGYLSTSFEVGGTIGTPLIGYISDQYMAGKRDLTAGIFMAGASLSLSLCILLSTWGPVVNAICMALTGILVIGPDSVLSGTIAQDIGQRSGLGKSAVGSVAGLLNSMGSAGSIFQSGVTAYISRTYGWGTLFLVFVACAAVSSAILFQVAATGLPPNQTLFKTVMASMSGSARKNVVS